MRQAIEGQYGTRGEQHEQADHGDFFEARAQGSGGRLGAWRAIEQEHGTPAEKRDCGQSMQPPQNDQ
jgi:hypothetical protein